MLVSCLLLDWSFFFAHLLKGIYCPRCDDAHADERSDEIKEAVYACSQMVTYGALIDKQICSLRCALCTHRVSRILPSSTCLSFFFFTYESGIPGAQLGSLFDGRFRLLNLAFFLDGEVCSRVRLSVTRRSPFCGRFATIGLVFITFLGEIVRRLQP